MPTFKPVIFETTSGYKFTVTYLHDVFKVMAMGWPNKRCPLYNEALCLSARAKEGWCTPKSAYDAFVRAAQAQKRIVEPRKLIDRVASELIAIEPENFNPFPDPSPMRSRVRRRIQAVTQANRKIHA
ncbi:MAG: DUF982 domain-containing protein [Aquamicrobium sp.]|nr:DUF982 domain-containing protein [Aquamicrobium sp.]